MVDCPHCNVPSVLSHRAAPGWMLALVSVAGMTSTGGVALASGGAPLVGWPLIVIGLAHYFAAWWTTSVPRGADLPGEPGDNIRS